MKPYIFCHMMTSVDGRIDCPVMAQLSADEYYIALDKLGAMSTLSGRVTAALEFKAVKAEKALGAADPIGHEEVYVAKKSDIYTIVVDTYGKLIWQDNQEEGYPLICILSEKAGQSYLKTLREQGISFIVTGKDDINLPKAMELLNKHFDVKRLAVVGGGHICGAFLKEGLIDEVSIMIAPGIDGRKGQTAVFDGIIKADDKPYKLKLESVEKGNTDIVWLRYKMRSA